MVHCTWRVYVQAFNNQRVLTQQYALTLTRWGHTIRRGCRIHDSLRLYRHATRLSKLYAAHIPRNTDPQLRTSGFLTRGAAGSQARFNISFPPHRWPRENRLMKIVKGTVGITIRSTHDKHGGSMGMLMLTPLNVMRTTLVRRCGTRH